MICVCNNSDLVLKKGYLEHFRETALFSFIFLSETFPISPDTKNKGVALAGCNKISTPGDTRSRSLAN